MRTIPGSIDVTLAKHQARALAQVGTKLLGPLMRSKARDNDVSMGDKPAEKLGPSGAKNANHLAKQQARALALMGTKV